MPGPASASGTGNAHVSVDADTAAAQRALLRAHKQQNTTTLLLWTIGLSLPSVAAHTPEHAKAETKHASSRTCVLLQMHTRQHDHNGSRRKSSQAATDAAVGNGCHPSQMQQQSKTSRELQTTKHVVVGDLPSAYYTQPLLHRVCATP